MHRLIVTLSDDEYETLSRVADERRVSVAELIREAVDAAHGTEHPEIARPGRPRGRKEE